MQKKEIISRLVKAGIDKREASNEARVLIEELFNVSAAGQLLKPDADFSSPALEDALSRRERREPLAYILGFAFFCGERYSLSSHCLIPRPETELVVEAATRLLPEAGRFADIGCGSGCISISLLCARTDLFGCAADISPEALEFARENAALNLGTFSDRLVFSQCDALKGTPLPGGDFDAIISNPPYIRSSVLADLEPELNYEPRIALDGGEDGLVFYRAIITLYSKQLKPEGLFVFEIGYDQGDAVSLLAQKSGYGCEIIRDLSGNDRVALLKRL